MSPAGRAVREHQVAIRRSWGRREVSTFVVFLETGDQVPILNVCHEQYQESQMAPAAGK